MQDFSNNKIKRLLLSTRNLSQEEYLSLILVPISEVILFKIILQRLKDKSDNIYNSSMSYDELSRTLFSSKQTQKKVTDYFNHQIIRSDKRASEQSNYTFEDIFGNFSGSQSLLAKISPYNPTQTINEIYNWINETSLDRIEGEFELLKKFNFLINEIASNSKIAGEFFTTDIITEFISRIASPLTGKHIYDPCFGSAGFLVSSASQILSESEPNENTSGNNFTGSIFSGVEINKNMFKIGLVRLLLTGVQQCYLKLGNTFDPSVDQNQKKYDVIFANPPFGKRILKIPNQDRPASFSEDNFIEKIVSRLDKDGRAFVIVPESFLFRQDTTLELRKSLLENNQVEAIVSLPRGALYKYSSLLSNILVINNNLPSENIWFQRIQPRSQVKILQNLLDLFNINKEVEIFRNRITTENSFNVKRQKVIGYNYDLTFKKFTENKLDLFLKDLSDTGASVEVVKLGQIAKIFRGLSISKADIISDEKAQQSDIRLLRVKDIQPNSISVPKSYERVTFSDDYLRMKSLSDGDILLTASGTVGRSAIIKNIGENIFASNSLQIIRVRVTDKLLPEYLLKILQSEPYTDWFNSFSRGSVISNLSYDDLKHLPIPVPNLDTQKRVVNNISIGENSAHLKQVFMKEDYLKSDFQLILRHLRNELVHNKPNSWENLLVKLKEVYNLLSDAKKDENESYQWKLFYNFYNDVSNLDKLKSDESRYLYLLDLARSSFKIFNQEFSTEEMKEFSNQLSTILFNIVEQETRSVREKVKLRCEISPKPTILDINGNQEITIKIANDSYIPLINIELYALPINEKFNIKSLERNEEYFWAIRLDHNQTGKYAIRINVSADISDQDKYEDTFSFNYEVKVIDDPKVSVSDKIGFLLYKKGIIDSRTYSKALHAKSKEPQKLSRNLAQILVDDFNYDHDLIFREVAILYSFRELDIVPYEVPDEHLASIRNMIEDSGEELKELMLRNRIIPFLFDEQIKDKLIIASVDPTNRAIPKIAFGLNVKKYEVIFIKKKDYEQLIERILPPENFFLKAISESSLNVPPRKGKYEVDEEYNEPPPIYKKSFRTIRRDSDRELSEKIGYHLFKKGIIDAPSLDKSLKAMLRDRKKLSRNVAKILVEDFSYDHDLIFKEVAILFGFRVLDIFPQELPEKHLDSIRNMINDAGEETKELILRSKTLPFIYDEQVKDKLIFASVDPTDRSIPKIALGLNAKKYEVIFIKKKDYHQLIEKILPPVNVHLKAITDDSENFIPEEEKEIDIDEDELDAEINKSALINLVEGALVEAVRKGAREIHIIPRNDHQTELYMKIGDSLELWHLQENTMPELLITILKDRGKGMNKYEREIPQEGSIRREIDGNQIEFNVSIKPFIKTGYKNKFEKVFISIQTDDETQANQISIQIKNPYNAGLPVDNPQMFFGRKNIIAMIRSQLKDNNKSDVIILEGTRRTGKTSILKHLESPGVLSEKWIPVLCDFQEAEGSSKGVGIETKEVFYFLSQKISDALNRLALGVEIPGFSKIEKNRLFKINRNKQLIKYFANDSPFRSFTELLDFWSTNLSGRKILLMLDEFDKIQEGIENKITNPTIIENFRSLFQHNSHIAAILSGSQRLRKIRNVYWSALYGLGKSIRIGFFNEDEYEEAMNLVEIPTQGILEFDEEAKRKIVDTCALQPYFIQSLCSRVFDYCVIKKDSNIVTLSDVNEAIKELIRDNEHFNTLWEAAIKSKRKQFLVCAIDFLTSETRMVSGELIKSKFAEDKISYRKEAELWDDLKDLLDLDIIRMKNIAGSTVYEIAVPLLSYWLKDHIDFEEAKRRAKLEGEEL